MDACIYLVFFIVHWHHSHYHLPPRLQREDEERSRHNYEDDYESDEEPTSKRVKTEKAETSFYDDEEEE
jgi:hypothetical protein